MKKEYGPITIEFRGKGNIADLVRDDFSDLKISANNPELIFQFPENDKNFTETPIDDLYYKIGTTLISEKKISLCVSKWQAHIEFTEKEITAHCFSNPNSRRKAVKPFPLFLQRLSNMYFKTVDELQSLDFIYAIFNPLIEAALLKNGHSLIHASSIHDTTNNKVILFTGWGGCGKTSASSYLILQDPKRWHFLADDLSIISSKGYVFYNPIGIHVYPYNLINSDILKKRNKEKMGSIEKLHWNLRAKLHGSEGVVRRHPPKNVYESTSTGGYAKQIIYLDRYSRDEPTVKRVTAEEIARRASNVLLYELNLFLSSFLSIGASNSRILNKNFLNIDKIYEESLSIFVQAMKDTELYRVSVPMYGFNPQMLSDYILKEIIDK